MAVAAAPPEKEKAEKKKLLLWRRAMIHSSFFFVIGFFSGFAPSTISDWSPVPVRAPLAVRNNASKPFDAVPRSLLARVAAATDAAADISDDDDLPESNPRRLAIVITTTAGHGERSAREAELTRMAQTLRLVPAPVVWIVVEPHDDAPATAQLLRATGVMYRHLAYKENFTGDNAGAAEAHHQRNVALGHVERHRLNGVVVFAGLGGAYDLQFFQEIRQIEAFGVWPVATVSATDGTVAVEGPTCSASRVTDWSSKNLTGGEKPRRVSIHSFGFNSSILWDPERWGRPTSEPDTSLDSMDFVWDAVMQDENKVKGLPAPDCSQVMVWRLESPPLLPLPLSAPPGRRRRR